jgi:hypothetical protein
MTELGFEAVANTPDEFGARLKRKSRNGQKSFVTPILSRPTFECGADSGGVAAVVPSSLPSCQLVSVPRRVS